MKKRMKILAAVLLLPLALCLSAGAAETDAQRGQDEAALRSAVTGEAQPYLAGTDGQDVAGSFARLLRNAVPDAKSAWAKAAGSLGAAVRTIPYGYGDASWSDLLTSIGGQSLTADEIGNLLSDGTWTYTWQHGRQLAGMSKSGQTIAYGYDSDGKRITKTVNGTTNNYH